MSKTRTVSRLKVSARLMCELLALPEGCTIRGARFDAFGDEDGRIELAVETDLNLEDQVTATTHVQIIDGERWLRTELR